MDVTKFIWGNIEIFSATVLIVILVRIFIKIIYTSLKSRCRYTNFGKYLTRTNIPHMITNIVLPVLFLASFTAFQQKYGGDKG